MESVRIEYLYCPRISPELPVSTQKVTPPFKELSKATWKDFETIMGPKGGCGGCWCMSWRVSRGGKYWESVKGETNRKAMKNLVHKGLAFGVLAYEGNEPIGWCSVGPKEHYSRLMRAKAYQRADCLSSWAVPCFFIRKDRRGKGLSARLLEQACFIAKKNGAQMVEGYPATKTKAGKKLPAAFVWTGPEAIFKRCGFREVQRLSWSRPLYRKKI